MKLLTKPTIQVMASTQINKTAFKDWLDANFDCQTPVEDTAPIIRLWNDVDDEFAGQRLIEFAGRHCYRAWTKGRGHSDYIRNLIDMGHESVLEHSSVSFAIAGVSRSLTHELIRHRVGVAISQESQRYVDASDINFVIPPLNLWVDAQHKASDALGYFEQDCEDALNNYSNTQQGFQTAIQEYFNNGQDLKEATRYKKRINEAARSLLPNATETRLVWTANYRLLRHFFFLRGGIGADLEIRRLAVALLLDMQQLAPDVFSDMQVVMPDEDAFGVPIIVGVNYE